MQHTVESVDQNALSRRWARAEGERETLIRIARSRGLSDQDAEDCVHEAMLRVVPRPDLDERRMGALLTTVVVRSAIDTHRRARTTARVAQRVAGATRTVADCDPASTVCDRDEARWAARLVEDLPRAQRQALMARAEGRSVNEIARDMATTAKAIESLIARARAATRSAMASKLTGISVILHRLRFKQFNALVGAGATMVVVVVALTGSTPSPPTSDGQTPDAPASAAVGPPASSTDAQPSIAAHAAHPAANGGSRGRGGATGKGGPPSGGGDGWSHRRVNVVVQPPTGRIAISQGEKGEEDFGDKVERCKAYGPTLDLDRETYEYQGGHICRYDEGSPIFRR